MIKNSFDISGFEPFEQSTKVDGNYTGTYDGKVVRIIEENKDEYKSLLKFSDQINSLVKSKFLYEDEKILVIEHEKLENITYYNEWTKKQQVLAARSIIEIQSNLAEKGFYLNDPHAFNITFRYHLPVYFDFGSIKKGKIIPAWWFIKGFCGWTAMDYWDSVLKINILQKLILATGMIIANSPYKFLSNKIAKFEKRLIEKRLVNLISSKDLAGKITRKIVNSFPSVFKNFSNWSDYEQKNPKLNFDEMRNKNLVKIFNEYKPLKVLDIGANRGAFSLLALETGTREAIALDLDNYSLDHLLEEIRKHTHKITVAKLNIMDYPERPGYFESYLAADERLNSDFTMCLAVVHHVCYFGNYSFVEFASKLNKFSKKTLIIEFVPYNDVHLTGAVYKGKDRSWYTLDNFVSTFKEFFPDEHEIFESTPAPRLLVKFSK